MTQLKQKAVDYLTARYATICLRYPMTRDYVSLKGYVSANLRYTMRNIQRKEVSQ